MMRRLFMLHLSLLLLLGLSCASKTSVAKRDTQDSHRYTVESWQSVYDRQEEGYLSLLEELEGKWGKDPQLIEARELAYVAEEFYLMGEYETAIEVLQQGILLLEEKQQVEEIYP
ncbi:MAG: hypothetical protein AMJ92_11420 [candidate division Zixibacteria bacterium SM23_81]|nr:MAG: hypothetical protein AMJ92_11420 [candidate division Zixibacteria bacterium SM23_81]